MANEDHQVYRIQAEIGDNAMQTNHQGHNLREVAEFAVPPPLETETGDRPPPLETETGDCPPPLETVTEDYPPVSGSAYEEHGGQFGPQTDLIALGALQVSYLDLDGELGLTVLETAETGAWVLSNQVSNLFSQWNKKNIIHKMMQMRGKLPKDQWQFVSRSTEPDYWNIVRDYMAGGEEEDKYLLYRLIFVPIIIEQFHSNDQCGELYRNKITAYLYQSR